MTVTITRSEDGASGRYAARVDGAPAGELSYRRQADRLIVTHTEAYRAYRGQGVAYALVERLARDARAEGSRIVPLCWYARDKLGENAEWRDLIEGGRRPMGTER